MNIYEEHPVDREFGVPWFEVSPDGHLFVKSSGEKKDGPSITFTPSEAEGIFNALKKWMDKQ